MRYVGVQLRRGEKDYDTSLNFDSSPVLHAAAEGRHWGASMAYFRCYFLRTDGHIQSAKVFECASDGDAIHRAQSEFRDQECPMFELWEGKRRVHAEYKAAVTD